ncbi:hypothetical protein HR08_01590 [Porphyromonas gulae]|uniref:Uncharacterized protein n=1 Tax=Porphyromonas gulae TaxID=111105 RepID=A0A0A2FCI0_9PORP|nr:hypothetical protein HR08_01590 [Porphyromonas gulae]
MNVSINGVRKSYWPKLGCAMNKGIDSAAKGSDENAMRQSLSELGYTGTFGKRGNVRQGKSASRSRKRSLQGGGSFFGVDLSPSNLEGAIAVQLCHAPSWRKVFRRGLVVLQVGAANFVSDLQVCTPNNLHCRAEMQIPRRTMTLSRPKRSPQLAGIHL